VLNEHDFYFFALSYIVSLFWYRDIVGPKAMSLITVCLD